MYLLGISKYDKGEVPQYDLFEYNEKNNKLLTNIIEEIKNILKDFKFSSIEDKKKNINKFYKSMDKYIKMSNIELINSYTLSSSKPKQQTINSSTKNISTTIK
jgi:hypothetical protein